MRRLAGWSHPAGGALVVAVGATLGATRFDLRLLGFLGVLGAVMPPILGVILVRNPRNADWHAWLGWGLGSTVALLLLWLGLPAHVLAGVATSSLTVVLLGILTGTKETTCTTS